MLNVLYYVLLCTLCVICICLADEGKSVETESIGHVLLIGINQPAKRNCVNQATAQQLCDAVKQFETDDELRVAVLYGKGLHFAVAQSSC